MEQTAIATSEQVSRQTIKALTKTTSSGEEATSNTDETRDEDDDFEAGTWRAYGCTGTMGTKRNIVGCTITRGQER